MKTYGTSNVANKEVNAYTAKTIVGKSCYSFSLSEETTVQTMALFGFCRLECILTSSGMFPDVWRKPYFLVVDRLLHSKKNLLDRPNSKFRYGNLHRLQNSFPSTTLILFAGTFEQLSSLKLVWF